MAKKRGKPKAISKKHIKKAKAIKKEAAKFERPRPFSDFMRGLEMLDEEKKIEHKVEEVEKKDDEEEKLFKVIKLKKKDLLKLKVLIEKELHNEKKSNVE